VLVVRAAEKTVPVLRQEFVELGRPVGLDAKKDIGEVGLSSIGFDT